MTTEPQHLLQNLRSKETATRLSATRQAGETRIHAASEQLVALLRDSSKAVQEAAAEALAAIGGREVIAKLLPLLESEEVSARNLAIQALARIGGEGLDLFSHVIETGSDDARIFVFDVLGMLSPPPPVALVARGLACEHVNVRNACVMALSSIGGKEVVPHLIRALGDDEWVRFSAVDGLVRCKDPELMPTLVKALQDSHGDEYYPGLLACFVELRRAESIVPLLDELGQVDALHHPAIVAALSELAETQGADAGWAQNEVGEGVVAGLGGLLSHSDPWVVFRTLKVIGVLGERRLVKAVQSCVEAQSDLVRTAAETTMARLNAGKNQ